MDMSGKLIGSILIILSLAIITIYGYLLFFSSLSIFIMKLTAFIGVSFLLALLGWVGFALIRSESVDIEDRLRELEKDLGLKSNEE